MVATDVQQVPFHGETLWATTEDGEIVVAVKPICDGLRIDWRSQRHRIRRDPVLSEGVRVLRMPSAGGAQDALCLRLDLLNGWLFGISEGAIKDPEVRERVHLYRRECFRVLYDHFHGRAEERVAEAAASEVEPAPPVAALDLDAARTWLGIVEAGRRVFGRAAARELWRQSPLPQPLDRDAGDGFGRWVQAALAFDAAARTPIADITAAFNVAMAGDDVPPLTAQQVGSLLRRQGVETKVAKVAGAAKRCAMGVRLVESRA